MKENRKIDLLDVATTFANRKKTILKIVGIVTVLGTIIAFIWPKKYEADLSFVVTDGNAINIAAGGLLDGLTSFSTNSSTISSDQALVIIRNKSIQDKVIEEFDLQEVYGTDIQEALRRKLGNSIAVEDIRAGGIGFNSIVAINLKYTDEDPGRAYSLLQYYYQLVDSTVQALNKKNVGETYALIEERLQQNIKDLKIAEDSLVSFQSRYGILEVEEHARAQISTIADLKAEMVGIEIQLDFLTTVLGENSSRVSELKNQKAALDRRYNQLMTGGNNSDDGETNLFQSMEELPGLFAEYLRRFREVMVQEEVYKVLYPQFEQQRMNFEEASSGLLIVDPAVIPTYKASPKRAYIMIAAFLFGCLLAVLVVLYRQWRDDLIINNPEEYQRFKAFTAALSFKNDKS